YGTVATLSLINVANLTNVTYSMQPGGAVSPNPAFTVAPLSNSAYTLYITGTNYLNAIVTNSGVTNVSVTPQPSVSPVFTQSTCYDAANGFNLGLTWLPGGSLSYSVNWAPIPNGITNLSQTSATGGIAPGVYNFTVSAS